MATRYFKHNTSHFFLQKCEGDDKDKKKEIVVLEMKRSQAINIGLTKLPPIRALKQAILAMDSAVIDREGIDVSVIRYILISGSSRYSYLQFVLRDKHNWRGTLRYNPPSCS